jgi:hypothetical protein
MARDGRRPFRVGTAADEVPRRIVEVGVEPGQHHRAAGKARDGREKARGGGHRAGRAGGDHRRARCDEAARFRRDQPVAPLRRLDRAAFTENRRPVQPRDLQELQRDLPILIEMIRHHGVEAIPRHLARRHIIEQSGQVVGERKCRRRMAHHERRLAGRGFQSFRPGMDEPRQEKTSLEAAERGRQVERVRGGGAARHVGEYELVLVEVPDRHDARQQRRLDPEHVEERIAREPAGAARRQEDGGRGKNERIGAEQVVGKPAVLERADERRQERHRRRNGEDARLHGMAFERFGRRAYS